MEKISDIPKRKFGQCLSCGYFYEKRDKCPFGNDIESTKFCYDWTDLEEKGMPWKK